MGLFDKQGQLEKQKSLEFAEDAREKEWRYPSFALKLFHGQLDWEMIHPFPRQPDADRKIGDEFLKQLEVVLREHLDPDEVDRTGEIPPALIAALAAIKAFAMKIPCAYGGLGLSQVNYNRAIHLVSSYCGSTAVMLSAHQSIGVPQPLKLFGTKEQKEKYFPLFVKGMISAFALTEPEAGSDPRNMSTTATPVEDGAAYVIDGEKLWCTNGPIAGVIVVMAVTPPKIVNGKEKKQITAFIVETDQPGVEVVHRCRFMGLNGIQNGLIRFRNVRVPRENIILGEGEGLKLALTTLNTGRLTLPAASTGIAKWCLHVVRQWAGKRHQWGAPIGEHESIALKCGDMASQIFAMDAVTWLTSAMADDKNKDIRIEAAMAKYFCTEETWRIVDDTLQIRGGQGYERSSSLRERGMDYWPVERVMRDMRINLIIEGTTEILHLFIAREALDPHLNRVKDLLSTHSTAGEKIVAVLKAARYYALWYPQLWLPAFTRFSFNDLPYQLEQHMYFVLRTSRRLGRTVFHQMMRYQHRLESRQAILSRLVDIGTTLFAMTATCAYAQSLHKDNPQRVDAVDLADVFCRQGARRIRQYFRGATYHDDARRCAIARKLLQNELLWLEQDILN